MNIGALHKVLNTIVKPKFPWINEIVIVPSKDDQNPTVWNVYYVVEHKVWNDLNLEGSEEASEVVKLTRNLYKALGFNYYERLGVEFYLKFDK